MSKVTRRGFVKSVVIGMFSFVTAARGLFLDVPTASAGNCDPDKVFCMTENPPRYACMWINNAYYYVVWVNCYSEITGQYCYGGWQIITSCN